MKDEILAYVKTKLATLSDENPTIKLTGVPPSIFGQLMDGFDWSYVELNGSEGDYWITVDKYEIEGSMYYGSATVSLRGHQEEDTW